jgi:biopolymer transport protein ExbD
MHGGGGGTSKRARIEIIPLIDIIFFLLATFVMVSLSMTKNQGVQVALPNAASAAPLLEQQQQSKALTLSVTEKGEVFFNKEKIGLQQLPFRLQLFKSAEKDPKVIVNGDAGADFKVVVAVLDEVRKMASPRSGSRRIGSNDVAIRRILDRRSPPRRHSSVRRDPLPARAEGRERRPSSRQSTS